MSKHNLWQKCCLVAGAVAEDTAAQGDARTAGDRAKLLLGEWCSCSGVLRLQTYLLWRRCALGTQLWQGNSYRISNCSLAAEIFMF